MILEWLDLIRTQSSRLAKDWGYTYQNISLKFRARRCARAWQGHVDHCQQAIREKLREIQPKSVMIIGSGILLEIPIHEILSTAEKVYLVDLVHSPEVRKLARQNKKIELIEKDVSALLGVLKQGLSPFLIKDIPWKHLPEWNMPVVDWVISANLLSQIPLMISEKISMTPERYQEFARKVRQQHLERLQKQGKKVLLIADFETRYIGKEEMLLEIEKVEVDLADYRFLKEWIWNISPRGETSPHYRIEMLVKAYEGL